MIRLNHVICLLLTTVCGVLCQSLDSVCAPVEFDRCTHNLRSLHNSRDGPVILRNEEELIQTCDQQQSALTCMNQYMRLCLPEDMKNVFKNMTSGSEEFVHTYCIGSSNDRKVYLKNLHCYNIYLNQLRLCTKRLQDWNRDLGKKPAHKEETMRRSCCLYNQAMSCQRTVIRNGCPPEGADLFDVMANKETRQFYQVANCDEYNYVMDKCFDSDGALSAFSPSLYSVLFGSAILVIFDKIGKFW